ncbi:NAD+ synthase [Candidatus Bathyarchaeota archaeon]|nr:NAD+ synthase [Candidatus Bathyarchaeota archaeon]
MKLQENLLQIDPKSIEERIIHFIQDYIKKAKAKGLILGLSGGVDSAVGAALSVKAVGSTKVLALYMPEEETYNKTDHQHVKLIAGKLGLQLKDVDLTRVLDTLYRTIPDYDPRNSRSRGNLKARTRMVILYYYANLQKRIVVGSSDKSEAMIGYFTKWGDGAMDIAPLMDLYKTQVRKLALHLSIPSIIVNKPSTPGLLLNQTAEQEIGLRYEILDLILYGLEHFMTTATIAKQLDLPHKTIHAIKKKWLQTEHKRNMPLPIKLQYRTINADFRLSREYDLEE